MKANDTIEEQKDHTLLYISIAAGVIVGGAVGYLFFTEQGAVYRKKIAEMIKENFGDAAEFMADAGISPKDIAQAGIDAASK